MKIAVLGCGPAGLMSAWAAKEMGHDVRIFSNPQKSVLGGSQYLHVPIPGLTPDEPTADLTILKFGTAKGYALKVYDDVTRETSWDQFDQGKHGIWNLRETYEHLWNYFGWLVTDLGKMSFQDVVTLSTNYDLVFSSLPMKAVCRQPLRHGFQSQTVWISYDHAPGLGGSQLPDIPNHHMVYNGEIGGTRWYRSSNLYGIRSTEFPGVMPECIRITKPLSHECNCFDMMGNVQFVGRYGKWEKGVLAHDAYYDTKKRLSIYEV
jgi:hypothetical protein